MFLRLPQTLYADLLDGFRTGVGKDIHFKCVAYKSQSSLVSSSMAPAPLYFLGQTLLPDWEVCQCAFILHSEISTYSLNLKLVTIEYRAICSWLSPTPCYPISGNYKVTEAAHSKSSCFQKQTTAKQASPTIPIDNG